jgi:hypothetical protein
MGCEVAKEMGILVVDDFELARSTQKIDPRVFQMVDLDEIIID